jgi:hypothetical protein
MDALDYDLHLMLFGLAVLLYWLMELRICSSERCRSRAMQRAIGVIWVIDCKCTRAPVVCFANYDTITSMLHPCIAPMLYTFCFPKHLSTLVPMCMPCACYVYASIYA